jgi:hypothetical protein
MDRHVTIEALREAVRCGSGSGMVTAAGERVREDPGAGSNNEQVATGTGGLDAVISGQPGQGVVT